MNRSIRRTITALATAVLIMIPMMAMAGDGYDEKCPEYRVQTGPYNDSPKCDIEQTIQIVGRCILDQAGVARAVYDAEGRPGAEFTVNGVNIGGNVSGGVGVFGVNTWSVTALEGYKIVEDTSGSFVIEDCTPATTTTTEAVCDPQAQPSCEPESTTTTTIIDTSTSISPTTTLDPGSGDTTTPNPTLPFTGPEQDGKTLIVSALALLVLGGMGLLDASKHRN